ncbi:MAG TPA: hypothetical protein PLH09_11740, partial [Lentimicrobium sp.]|nr:hypothetical protein [Lentimicrobium sp.]
MKLINNVLSLGFLLVIFLSSCNGSKGKEQGTSADSTEVAQMPDTTTLKQVEGDFDRIPLQSGIEAGKPSLRTPENKDSQMFEAIVFKGKGAEERRKGVSLASAGDLQGAIREFTKSIEIHQKNPDAYFYRGKAKWELKDYAGADQDFSKAIEIRPSQAPYFYYRGQMYNELKRFNEALADFDSTLARAPHYMDALNFKG